MDATTTKADRLDRLDAERMRDMVQSPPFQQLMARVKAELDRVRLQCERAEGRDLYRAQGASGALRTVLALPDQVIKEIECHKK